MGLIGSVSVSARNTTKVSLAIKTYLQLESEVHKHQGLAQVVSAKPSQAKETRFEPPFVGGRLKSFDPHFQIFQKK